MYACTANEEQRQQYAETTPALTSVFYFSTMSSKTASITMSMLPVAHRTTGAATCKRTPALTSAFYFSPMSSKTASITMSMLPAAHRTAGAATCKRAPAMTSEY
jgi:hypothetical protein